MSQSLEQLIAETPLPSGWSAPERHAERFELSNVLVHLIGLVSKGSCGEMVTGSAASFDGPPTARAYYELLERISVVEAEKKPTQTYRLLDHSGTPQGEKTWQQITVTESQDWKFSRSNGVAVGPNWERSTLASQLELLERHRILSSWYGSHDPVPLPTSCTALPYQWNEAYEFGIYDFSDPNDGFAVAGVFCFPKQEGNPRGLGFGAGESIIAAVNHAERECIQSIGFLWGESIPNEEIAFAPLPDYHQDFYLMPRNVDKIRRWLNRGHSKYYEKRDQPKANIAQTVFADITPESLRGNISVCKAINPTLLPLVFGVYNPIIPACFPWELRIHPVA